MNVAIRRRLFATYPSTIYHAVMVLSVLIVDDEPLVRDAYRAFLQRRPEFELVAEATNGEEAVAAASQHLPDVVLMDLQMPVLDGVEATRQICAARPDACVVVMTTFSTTERIVPALQAGAAGYLLKDVTAEGLTKAIHQAVLGEMPLAAAVRRALVQTVAASHVESEARLTPRETELVTLLAEGLSNAQIAERMFLSEGSVKQYLSQVATKLGVRTRTQVLVRAIQTGLVTP